jgi:hypothetical protein
MLKVRHLYRLMNNCMYAESCTSDLNVLSDYAHLLSQDCNCNLYRTAAAAGAATSFATVALPL